MLKSFITKALEYKAILNFKNNLYALLRISYWWAQFMWLHFDAIVYGTAQL